MKATNTGDRIIIETDHGEAAALVTALDLFVNSGGPSDPIKEKMESLLEVLRNPIVKK